MFKLLIQTILESYVKKYFKRHPEVKLVAVTGSVGKTSAKIAIATVLSEKLRVRMHDGNHNTAMSAPLAILGVKYPENIYSIANWLEVFAAIKERIKEISDVDVIVQELGSDHPGEVKHFGSYLKPDIGVITAVSPEHMEFFKTIDNVAKEELYLANYSKEALINRDDIDGKYSKYLTNSNINTYGTSSSAEYYFISNGYDAKKGYNVNFFVPNTNKPISATIKVVGEHNLRSCVVAGAVASKLGLSDKEIKLGLENVRPVFGRMNPLVGVNGSLIIDDSYNSSPLAVESALRTIYQMSSPQKIAILGDMNELGDTTQAEHEKIGKLCDPSQLSWLITVGKNANMYIAKVAKASGCQVKSFDSAILAGAFVRGIVEKDGLVLVKGSQGDIYLEEATKILLEHSEDESKLVRQSNSWMDIKNKFFKDL